MFGTNEQFNLERLPFSVYGAFLSVYQDLKDGKMYLSMCRGFQALLERPSLLELNVLEDGESALAYEHALIMWNQGYRDEKTIGYLYRLEPEKWETVFNQI